MKNAKKMAITILLNIAEVCSLILPLAGIVYFIVVLARGGTAIHIIVGVCKAIFILACGIALLIFTLRFEKINSQEIDELNKKLAQNNKKTGGIPAEVMGGMNSGMMGGMPPMDDMPPENIVDSTPHVEDLQPSEQEDNPL